MSHVISTCISQFKKNNAMITAMLMPTFYLFRDTYELFRLKRYARGNHSSAVINRYASKRNNGTSCTESTSNLSKMTWLLPLFYKSIFTQAIFPTKQQWIWLPSLTFDLEYVQSLYFTCSTSTCGVLSPSSPPLLETLKMHHTHTVLLHFWWRLWLVYLSHRRQTSRGQGP